MSSRFQPPAGSVVAVRAAAMRVRTAREGGRERLRCPSRELMLPEIGYVPGTG